MNKNPGLACHRPISNCNRRHEHLWALHVRGRIHGPREAESPSISHRVGFPLFSRKIGVVNFFEAGLFDVSIDLSRADIGMAQHDLNRTKVGAVIQEMGCEGMTQHMRGYGFGDSGPPSPGPENFPESLPGERPAQSSQEDSVGGTFFHERRSNVFEKVADQLPRHISNRDDPLFVPFAGNLDKSHIQIDTTDLQMNEF